MHGYDGTRHHSFAIPTEATSLMIDVGEVTHLRLNYFPDGGVARIRAYGRSVGRRTSTKTTTAPGGGGVGRIIVNHDEASPPLSSRDAPSPLPSMRHHPCPKLSSELNGGIDLACSNAHYGMPSELLRPELGTSMNDGWETARHPDRPPVVTRDANTGLQDTTLSDWSMIKLGLGGAVGGGGGGGGGVIASS
jgi:allantoicase